MTDKNKAVGRKLRLNNYGVVAFLTFVVSIFTVSAQQNTITTGGNASGSGGSVSFSVGQVVYSSNEGTDGSEIQGIQQPYEIKVLTEIDGAKNIYLSVSASSNTTKDDLLLSVVDFKVSKLSYRIFDTNGKLLESKKLGGTSTTINLSNFLFDTYFVKIYAKNNEIKTFKVVKNK